MINKSSKKLLSLISIATASFALSHSANATIVEFVTSQGNIQVNLYDQATPETVENFLSYVNDGYYTETVMHRSVPGFIVQGGGYEFEGDWPLTRLEPNAAITNEAIYSNVTGTIAMAKVGDDINSASDQWFFNLADNSANLDLQNGGFTVFGQVIGDGMEVINKIAALDLCDTYQLQDIPVIKDEDQLCSSLVVPAVDNFVVVEQIVVIDSSEATADDLNPLITKYPDSDGDGVKDVNDAYPSDPTKSEEPVAEDGGSMTWFSIALLSLLAFRKRVFKA